jgi:hypothetical protein
MSDSESNSDDEMKKVTEEFKEMVVSWVKIDDKIRDLSSTIKELKDEKKQFEEFILEYMSNVQENVINISDGKLRLNKATTKAPLKEENITESLIKYTNDKLKAEQLTKFIYDNRPTTTRTNLKRTKFRKKKKKKVKEI